MKNMIIFVLSIVITFIGAIMNAATLIDTPLSVRNLIVSILVLIFWVSYIVLSRTSGKMMLYATIFWCITFILTVLAIFGAIGKFTLGIIYMPILLFLSPVFGIRYIIHNPIENLSIIAIIALAFIINSIYVLKHMKLA